MSENTKIQWANSTFNPWIGCTKVSPGCAFCYAENSTPTRTARAKGRELWGKGQARQRTSASYWKGPLKWDRDAEKQKRNDIGPFRERRPRVFPSLCDWLDDEVPIEWLADFLKLIHETPNLDWLLLTKRPENFTKRIGSLLSTMFMRDDWRLLWVESKQAPANVWIGTSVEDQKRADERIPELLKIPAAVRFLSVEPLLGPVDLSTSEKGDVMVSVDWVIVGGESGPGARPCNVEWIRDIVRQCKAADVPCFVKQLGSRPMLRDAPPPTYPPKRREYIDFGDRLKLNHPKGGDQAEWPEDLRVREFPNAELCNRAVENQKP